MDISTTPVYVMPDIGLLSEGLRLLVRGNRIYKKGVSVWTLPPTPIAIIRPLKEAEDENCYYLTVTEPSDMTHHRFIFQVEAIFPGAELPSFLKKTSSEEASLRKDLA